MRGGGTVRDVIIVFLILTALASLKAENVRQDREIKNLWGAMRDQNLTIQYETHPAVMSEKIFRWYERDWGAK
jgi:hypothetical protein